jgi:hypothetical protein
MKALLIVLFAAGVARAQAPLDPGFDEPVPVEPPPVIYVPLPPVAAPAAKPSTGRFVANLDVGGVYRYALKASFGAAAVHALIGGDSGALRFGGVIDVELGASGLGLFYSVIDTGFEFSGRIGDRLRIGLLPHLGLMVISRRTDNNPASDLSGFLVGIAGTFTIDLARFTHSTLLLVGRLGYDFVDTGRLYSYANGMTAQLGVGFQL